MRRHSSVLLRLASAPGLGRIESVRTLMSTVSLHGGQAGDTMGGPVVSSTPCVHYVVMTYDCDQETEERLSVFSSPHLSLDSDSARLLTELTAAAASDSTDRLVAALGDIQSHANPRPGVLVHFQVSPGLLRFE